MSDLAFGPVPSRRLGRSLGVNNIPAKYCTYSCVYCQIGRTINLTVERRRFYDPEKVVENVLKAVEASSSKIDYITFVPDGEPTLDENLGQEASMIKSETGYPTAILTNSSLIFMESVRKDLMNFDLVSFKFDADSERTWRRINRPHPSLKLEDIKSGIRTFSKQFPGKILVEVMLVNGVNTDVEEIRRIADFLSKINLDKVFIAVPTRPPAEKWVEPADEEQLVQAHEIFEETLGHRVELLTGYEGPDFNLIKDPVESLLAILAVHPMRIDYAYHTLKKSGLNPEKTISDLLRSGKIQKIEYRGSQFLIRKLVRDGAAGIRTQDLAGPSRES